MKLPTIISFNDASNKPFQFDTLEAFTKFIKTEESFWSTKLTEVSDTHGF